tara:strand:+ start:1308 stop:2276 length:969 start_codon:yes stop_codon:yes gene_type:complete
LFPWLREVLSDDSSQPLLILGDITDAKDGHSAALVDRMVSELVALDREVYVLKGNHDYIDPATPFFGFLDQIENITFITQPELVDVDGLHVLFLPHTRTPSQDWTVLVESEDWKPSEIDLICCHQTFDGADAGGGHRLTGGVSSRFFSDHGFDGLVLSGDIHVPQKIGDVTYIGTPYPITFGDDHDGRVLALGADATDFRTISVPTIRKLALNVTSAVESFDINAGDQVKVRVSLERAEFAAWDEIKQAIVTKIERQGGKVHSVELLPTDEPVSAPLKVAADTQSNKSPQDILQDFCRYKALEERDAWMGEDILAAAISRGQ